MSNTVSIKALAAGTPQQGPAGLQMASTTPITIVERLRNARYMAQTAMQVAIAAASFTTFIALTVLLFKLVNQAYKADQDAAIVGSAHYAAYMMEVARHPERWVAAAPAPPASAAPSTDKEKEAELKKLLAEKGGTGAAAGDAGTRPAAASTAAQGGSSASAVPQFLVPDRLINSEVILALIAALITQLGASVYLLVKHIFPSSDA